MGIKAPKGAFGYWGTVVASDCPDLTGTSYTAGAINFYTDGATCTHTAPYQNVASQPIAITVRTDSGSTGGIIYNGFFTWYVGTGLPLDTPPVGAIDLQRVTSHETGHLLGLGHMQLRKSTGTQPYLRVCDNMSTDPNNPDIQCNGRAYAATGSGYFDQYGLYVADYGENIGSLVPTMAQGSPDSILCTRSLADGDRTSAVRDYTTQNWPALYP